MKDRHYVRVSAVYGELCTTIGFFCGPEDNDDVVMAKAERLTGNMRSFATVPVYKRFKIIERRPVLKARDFWKD